MVLFASRRREKGISSPGKAKGLREAKGMPYRIVMPPHIEATNILQETLGWLQEDKPMQADRGRLLKAFRSPAKYPLLIRAPLPTPVRISCCEAC